MFFYNVYGLNLQSYRELNGLKKIENNEKIDVYIKEGNLKSLRKEYLEDKQRWLHYSKEFTIFNIRNKVTYYIKNGKEIIVDEKINNSDSDEDLTRTFLLGTSLGLLMEQRNKVAIHGGSILIEEGKVLIITGVSGAGKSTLTTGFRLEGHKFLADDVSAIKEENSEVLVESAIAQRKVCVDMMEKMGYRKEEFKLIDECRGKYVIPDEENFLGRSEKLKILVEVVESDVEEVVLEEIKAMEKINLIVRNIYRGEIFLREAMKPEYFQKILNIAKNIKAYKLLRPKNKFTVDEQIEVIKNVI